MSDDRRPTSRSSSPLLACLHLCLATTLVVVHPLLDVLVRHPDYFLARQIDYSEAVGIGLGLWLLAPLPLVALRLSMGASSRTRRLAPSFDAAILGCAGALFFYQAFHGTLSHLRNPAWLVFAGLAVAFSVFLLWRRVSTFRTFFTFLAPALVAVPAVYIFHPNLVALKHQPSLPAPIPAEQVADTPVVVMVFDALSASALMRADRYVNEIRFPHLAALADSSLWFTHATTVASWTPEALPALITGRYPDAESLPGWRNHPENLFTALADSHRIVAVEPIFQHCPQELNQFLKRPRNLTEHLASVGSDLGILYLHRTLPSALSRSLPAVDENWGGFGEQDPRRTAPIYQLLDAMEPQPTQPRAAAPEKPTLYFVHAVFPHMPYVHLPSGRTFRTRPDPYPDFAALRNRTQTDVETEAFLYRRYLFQVGLVDRLVGDLVDRLREVGLYDRSLIVLTADHGSRTGPRVGGRDILFIPFLVKLPHSSETGVRDDRVSNLDLVPTILDVLGAPEPWWTEGRSVMSSDYRPPSDFIETRRQTKPDDFWTPSQRVIDWKIEHFGLGEDPLLLFRAGSPRPDLLGMPLRRLETRPISGVTAEIDEGGPVLDVDLDSGHVPVLLRGSLFFESSDGPKETMPQIVVSLNGTVEAVVTSRRHEEPNWYRFRLTVPESAYRSGPNEIRIWLVDADMPHRLLGPLPPRT